jgi:alpha-galactosidase
LKELRLQGANYNKTEIAMDIIYHPNSGEFHLFNQKVSYIIKILSNNQLGNLYYGNRVIDRESFSHLQQESYKSLAAYVFPESAFSLEYTRQEYPSYGTTDFHDPAFEIEQENGSRISNFEYQSHEIFNGKKKLCGLPCTYVENEEEAKTLEITLYDNLIGCRLILSYTIFRDFAAIARNARFQNDGDGNLLLNRALSMSVDFPDSTYEMVHLAGAWGRERHIKTHLLEQGIQSIASIRGASSAEHNPFLALKRPNTDEHLGEVYGFSLVYSGNFLTQVEVDTHRNTRVLMGIHPQSFSWRLHHGQSFQTPEVVLTYSANGLNGMSQIYHKLYRTRLARGRWRDKVRPILINNWEATNFEFDEESILQLAEQAKTLGIEMLVLDDGWFGKRINDNAGLGDWYINHGKIPDGISGLSQKVEALGLKFGLWFEPEMVNKDSDLYRMHPDWILSTPNRRESYGRNQYVLDFSTPEIVDHIYGLMSKIFRESAISYVKWDMNRYITECFSRTSTADRQGEVMHRYILGVYSLYERLTQEFPEILFEGCASGGARFDPGMLYYAPQSWTSDDTDAMERLKIQYGTSLVYPLSSISAHVSDVPNQQILRVTPLETRANVAYFGVFGYELDLSKLSEQQKSAIKAQVSFAKKHRELLQKGVFYRIKSPFEGNVCAWMVVSEDRSEALIGYYQILNEVNVAGIRLHLCGLSEDSIYIIESRPERGCYGDELMNAGLVIDRSELCQGGADFSSVLFYLKVAE